MLGFMLEQTVNLLTLFERNIASHCTVRVKESHTGIGTSQSECNITRHNIFDQRFTKNLNLWSGYLLAIELRDVGNMTMDHLDKYL